MGSFNLKAAQDNVKKDRPSSWRYLDVPWDPDSDYPVKVRVHDGGGQYGAWGEEYGRIRQEHGESVKQPGKQKKLLNLHSVGQLPVKVQRAAEKAAIKESKCVTAVAYVGPTFKNEAQLQKWVDGDLEVRAGGDIQKAPDGVKDLFVQTSDGWKIPESATPPEEWIDDKDGLVWFMTQTPFRSQIAIIRARLEDESGQSEADEEASKNSESGPSTKARKGV